MNYSAYISFFILFKLIISIKSAFKQPEINGANTALMYLSRFGYMNRSATNPEIGNLLGANAVREAILDFQAFAGIDQTGTLDEETIKMMNTPRCGVVDKVGYGSNARRKKRYALQGSRWKVKQLKYRITKYPRRLKRSEVDIDIKKAFEVWSDVTDLSFEAVDYGKVHIEIRFERSEHGDGDPFDGPGGTLAHAYFPIYGGDAHFDDAERWSINSYSGTNLFQVAAHEFGHSLGLSHSDVRSSLMAPFYRGYQPNFKLDLDDITGIQALYGEKNTPRSRPTKPVNPSKPSVGGNSAICKDSSVDAITTMTDGSTYVFKGRYYYKLDDNGIQEGYPKTISSRFSDLPSNLDGAFTWTNGKTYFFKGTKYWRFEGFKLDKNYPKYIKNGFMGIPNNIDAVFVWSGNGKIYFFKGSSYYKFDNKKRPPVAKKYPKDISLWEGIPNNIDAALKYTNGFTYFFKGGKYWRFNDRGFQVDSSDPAFPRPIGPWWFGCSEKGFHTDTKNETTPTDDEDYNIIYDDSFNTDDYHYSFGKDHHIGYMKVGHEHKQSKATTIYSFSGSIVLILIAIILR